MPIWVRVAVRRPGGRGELEVSAKVNTGFTVGPYPVLRLPRALAEELGFDVEHAEPIPGIYDAAMCPLVTRRLGLVEVRISVPDRETRWVRAIAMYMEGGATTLINDVLAGKRNLGIVIEDPETGLWRLADDIPGLVRESAEQEFFIPRRERRA